MAAARTSFTAPRPVTRFAGHSPQARRMRALCGAVQDEAPGDPCGPTPFEQYPLSHSVVAWPIMLANLDPARLPASQNDGRDVAISRHYDAIIRAGHK